MTAQPPHIDQKLKRKERKKEFDIGKNRISNRTLSRSSSSSKSSNKIINDQSIDDDIKSIQINEKSLSDDVLNSARGLVKSQKELENKYIAMKKNIEK